MKNSVKRWISFVLCFVMLAALVPCLSLEAEGAYTMTCYVGDTFEYPSHDCVYDSCWVDHWNISPSGMVSQYYHEFTFLKAGTVTISASYKANNYDETPGYFHYHGGTTYTITVLEKSSVNEPIKLYHDMPFCGGGIFPEIRTATGAKFTVTDANIYKEMCDYYPGDTLPNYDAGTTLLCVIWLQANDGYVFPDKEEVQTCYVNGREAKIYYDGDTARVYYDVVLKECMDGPIEVYHDLPFCSAGMFPEVYADYDALYTVTEANIYKEMCDYYPGDILPGYYPGTELLCVITLKADEGYAFPAEEGERTCYINGQEASIYYHDDTARIHYDVVLEASKIGMIYVHGLSWPTAGSTALDRSATVEDCTVSSITYTRNGREQTSFAAGDEIQITLRVTCDNTHVFEEGRTAFLYDENDEYYLTSRPSTLISDREAEYVFDYTIPEGEGTQEPAVFPFTDVPGSSWYYPEVKTAWENDLVAGMSATTFGPQGYVTYAQAVAAAAKMHQKYTTGSVTLTNGSPWYQSYVDYCKANGIIDKDYPWNENATRGGYMEIFANALPDEAMAQINSIPDGSIPDVPMTHPQAEAIYKMYRVGIVNGMDAQTHICMPESNIKRTEISTLMNRMMGLSARQQFSMGQ